MHWRLPAVCGAANAPIRASALAYAPISCRFHGLWQTGRVSKPRTWLSWSSGKDSAWALHVLRQRDEVEVTGLVTTVNTAFDRVAMHAVRRELLEAQAAAVGLPLHIVSIPYPCANEEYERAMSALVGNAVVNGVTHMAFGDLFLEDIRQYREQRLAGTGIAPLFPLWRVPTPVLAREMIAAGTEAYLTCVDPKHLDPSFAGRRFDGQLLNDLPDHVDPCGEKGEFHTFVADGPAFLHRLPVQAGEVVTRDGFVFADLFL